MTWENPRKPFSPSPPPPHLTCLHLPVPSVPNGPHLSFPLCPPHPLSSACLASCPWCRLNRNPSPSGTPGVCSPLPRHPSPLSLCWPLGEIQSVKGFQSPTVTLERGTCHAYESHQSHPIPFTKLTPGSQSLLFYRSRGSGRRRK